MEEDDQVSSEMRYVGWQMKSPEIVEIGEDCKSIISSRNGVTNDVYVAVGKNDLHLVQWALDHHVTPGTQLFLVHVFPPITYIPTPVGRLSRSQLSKDQLRVYENEEQNRRRNLLEKYIHLCNDAKVPVDTMLLESSAAAKAILDLIPVVNITNLIMGTKRYLFTRQLRMGQGKGEFVKKNAPDFCKVMIIYNGKKILNGQLHQETEAFPSTIVSGKRPESTQHTERNFFECIMCFSAGAENASETADFSLKFYQEGIILRLKDGNSNLLASRKFFKPLTRNGYKYKEYYKTIEVCSIYLLY